MIYYVFVYVCIHIALYSSSLHYVTPYASIHTLCYVRVSHTRTLQVAMGEEGYSKRVSSIVETTRTIAEGR